MQSTQRLYRVWCRSVQAVSPPNVPPPTYRDRSKYIVGDWSGGRHYFSCFYYKRTRDKAYWRHFWMSRSILSAKEYVLNRIGFWMMVTGIVFLLGVLTLLNYHK